MVFTIMYVGRVFGETTIYFLGILWENDHFLEILGHFGPLLAISRYSEYQMFFPCIIFFSMTFSHQFSCFNIHNIQKLAFFGQIFTKWGPFWVPRFLKKCLQLCFLILCMQAGFLDIQLSISWHCSEEMTIFLKFSSNGGHFGYLDLSKYIFSNRFYYYVCRKGFWRTNYLFHGIIIEKWLFFGNFGLLRVIFGHFQVPSVSEFLSHALFSLY